MLVYKGCVSSTLLSAWKGNRSGLPEHSGKVSARSFGSGSGPVSSSDSELSGTQVRLESGTLFTEWGSGPPLSAEIFIIMEG